MWSRYAYYHNHHEAQSEILIIRVASRKGRGVGYWLSCFYINVLTHNSIIIKAMKILNNQLWYSDVLFLRERDAKGFSSLIHANPEIFVCNQLFLWLFFPPSIQSEYIICFIGYPRVTIPLFSIGNEPVMFFKLSRWLTRALYWSKRRYVKERGGEQGEPTAIFCKHSLSTNTTTNHLLFLCQWSSQTRAIILTLCLFSLNHLGYKSLNKESQCLELPMVASIAECCHFLLYFSSLNWK